MNIPPLNDAPSLQVAAGLATITLRRPALRNSFNNERDDYDKCRAVDRSNKSEVVHYFNPLFSLARSRSAASSCVISIASCIASTR